VGTGHFEDRERFLGTISSRRGKYSGPSTRASPFSPFSFHAGNDLAERPGFGMGHYGIGVVHGANPTPFSEACKPASWGSEHREETCVSEGEAGGKAADQSAQIGAEVGSRICRRLSFAPRIQSQKPPRIARVLLLPGGRGLFCKWTGSTNRTFREGLFTAALTRSRAWPR